MIKDVEIRHATAEDIKIFYPEGSPHSVQAWVALYKGRIDCLAGVIIKRGSLIPFCDVRKTEASQITIWKTAKVLFEHIKSLNLPLITATQGRSKFLEKLGFKHNGTHQGWETYTFKSNGG